MQLITVLTGAFLAVSAISAAKLPLSPPSRNAPVPQLSTLYEAPLEDLPAASQSALALQIPAEFPQTQFQDTTIEQSQFIPIQQSTINVIPVPAEPSGLYELPVGPIPSPAQQTFVSQVPKEVIQVVSIEQSQDIPVQELTSIAVPVPVEPSGLYELPVDSIPSPDQQTFVSQVSEESIPVISIEQSQDIPVQEPNVIVVSVPAEPSGLYELPVDSIPSPAQQTFVSQISEESIPVISLEQSQDIPVQEPTVIAVPVPAEPSDLYQLPVDSLASPAQQTFVSQVSEEAIPVVTIEQSQDIPVQEPTVIAVLVPAESSDLFELPIDSVPSPAQQTFVSQVSQEAIPVPFEPATLYETPIENAVVPSLGSSIIQSTQGIDSVPTELIGSQNVQSGAASFPVQQITQESVEPISIFENQLGTASGVHQSSILEIQGDIVPVPAEPSTLYDLPSEQGPSSTSQVQVHSEEQGATTFNSQGTLSQDTIISQSTFSQDFEAPSVPSGLYEVPQEAPLFQAESGLSQSQVVPVQNVQQIQEPAQTSTINEVSSAASEPVATVAKNMMMLMPYNFAWGVDDGENAFTHTETSDGQRTSGEYRVTLPDGRVQVVNFYDNGDGFHADVTYE